MTMKDLLDKISSYNLFNYLLPGVLFVVFLDRYTKFSLIQENLAIGVFVYYFIGLVISRFGSLIVEPILKGISFVKFAKYAEYIVASNQDPKIETLSEANNMYRTLCATFALLGIAKIYEWLDAKVGIESSTTGHIIVALLLVLFLFSYRKQTVYVSSRVKAHADRL
jgi:hypothetical protein